MRFLARFGSPRGAATVVLVAIALGALAFVVGYARGGNGPAAAEYQYPTTICHRTMSVKNPWQIITVSNNAVPAHKAHGDTLVAPGNTCPGPPIP